MNLKELSRRLGLSQTTVSRALNGYPEVSEKTRRRVAEYAERLNYQPNPNATRLATGKSNTIGHVIPLSGHDMINPHFSDFIAGAGEVYNRRGYDMLISVVNAAEQSMTYKTFHRNKRVDGVIVHSPTIDDDRIAMLNRMRIPFVVHGRTGDPEDSYSWVDVDNADAFQKATRYLLELGHRRIALINGLEPMTFAARRREGYEAALVGFGLKPDKGLVGSAEMIEPNGHKWMGRLLDSPAPPTAVLCSSILTTMGAMRLLRERGLTPGRDMSIVGYDDRLSFLPSSGEDKALTAVRSGIRLAGSHCADMLIDQIEGKTGNRHLLLEAEFVIGNSTGPAPRN
ncbi:LacI family DNA-binding transcriptional regulator [Oricola cellulosilytica]|uniref:LacI family transcriptional regulator n=1 Tax=Oricola cellulosilytica TaxID=1429082 RepID=A0A4R0PJ19_9HYPH|nr:LacI family DNA-binding transcriptional regulator [Oricola cellulosilytica]TCD16440.1 LacI family transcriptional regulator [Oricola cellulosilytica]